MVVSKNFSKTLLLLLLITRSAAAVGPGKVLSEPKTEVRTEKLYLASVEKNSSGVLAFQLLWIPSYVLGSCLGTTASRCREIEHCTRHPETGKGCGASSPKRIRSGAPSKLLSTYVDSTKFSEISRLSSEFIEGGFLDPVLDGVTEVKQISEDLAVSAEIRHEVWENGSNITVLSLRSAGGWWKWVKSWVR